MPWTNDRAKYEQIARTIEPAARLSTKDSWLWTALWVVGVVLTVGLLAIKMGRKTFLENYATTLGPIQGYPRGYSRLSKRLLVHECRHTTHCVWLGWLIPIVGWFFGRRVRAYAGLLPYAVLYLILLFPIGFCIGRWLFELDADRTSWRWQLRNGYTPEHVKERAGQFARKVCGGQYVWAWIPWLGGIAAFERAADKVIAEWRAA
jgi:hypothetical protein